MCIDHTLDFGDLCCRVHETVLFRDLNYFCCDGLARWRLLGSVEERAVHVGEIVAESFGVFGTVFVYANLASRRICVDDVLQESLLEGHGAVELFSAGTDGRLQADHVEL